VTFGYRKSRDEWSCYDCGMVRPEYHMLWDGVWEKAWDGKQPPHEDPRDPRQPLQLCFACLEKRLGRPLANADFTTAPVNNFWLR